MPSYILYYYWKPEIDVSSVGFHTVFSYNEFVYGHIIKITIKTEITSMTGTCVTFSTATREKAGALWAGAGVASRPQQTQVTACTLTRVLHCWGETVYRHSTLSISMKSL